MKKILFIAALSLMHCNIKTAMPILSNATENLSNAFDNCNPKTNGEYRVIKEYIKNGFIIFDVGANHGEWSTVVIETAPKAQLHAFEPGSQAYGYLQKKIQSPLFHPHNIAVGNKVAFLEFALYANDELNSLFPRDILGKPLTTVKVPVTTIDAFCAEENIDHIDFLKIDTEGAEYIVLEGAANMLSLKKIDMIQFEYGGTYPDASRTLKEVYYFLTGKRYSIFLITQKGLVAIPHWDDSLENFRYSNYLAIAKNISTF